MPRPSSPAVARRRHLLISLALVLLGVVSLFAALTLPERRAPEVGQGQAAHNPFVRGDRLTICVKAAAGASIDVGLARQTIEIVLVRLRALPDWSKKTYAGADPQVDENCRESPTILNPGFSRDLTVATSRETATPPWLLSRYLYIMFVVPDAIIRQHFWIPGHEFNVGARRTAEEFVCHGHTCAERTSGLYLTPQEALSEEYLYELLGRNLSLGVPHYGPDLPPPGYTSIQAVPARPQHPAVRLRRRVARLRDHVDADGRSLL